MKSFYRIHRYALFAYRKVENPEHTFVIGSHGSTRVFQDRNGKNIDQNILADIIKNDPNYSKGDSIRLLSCNTGGKTKGYDNYAQRLADAMDKVKKYMHRRNYVGTFQMVV